MGSRWQYVKGSSQVVECPKCKSRGSMNAVRNFDGSITWRVTHRGFTCWGIPAWLVSVTPRQQGALDAGGWAGDPDPS